MEATMKSLRGSGNAAVQTPSPLLISRHYAITFGLLIASSLSTSLLAQDNAPVAPHAISTQNQNFETKSNTAMNTTSTADLSALPDAPVPNVSTAANVSG